MTKSGCTQIVDIIDVKLLIFILFLKIIEFYHLYNNKKTIQYIFKPIISIKSFFPLTTNFQLIIYFFIFKIQFLIIYTFLNNVYCISNNNKLNLSRNIIIYFSIFNRFKKLHQLI